MRILSALMSVCGALVLFWALRGYRTGRELRCRTCNYELKGNVSGVCSECGTALDASSIVRGSLRRRPVVAGLGLILVAAGGLGIVAQLSGTAASALCPFPLLMYGAQSGHSGAIRELVRRCHGASLSQAQRSEVIELCLARQALASTSDPNAQCFVDLLQSLCAQGSLTAQQFDRYLGQAIRNISVKPATVQADGRLRIELTYEQVLPQRGLYAELMKAAIVADGEVVDYPDCGRSERASLGISVAEATILCRLAKRPESVRLEATISLHDGTGTVAGHLRSIPLEETVVIEPDGSRYLSSPC